MNARLLTHNAGHADDLSESDYRDIYDELRTKTTLRQFVAMAGEQPNRIAWWSKYEAGALPLTRPARNALRRAVGLPELAPTVAEAVGAVDPNAAVWQIGDGRADRMLLVAVAGPVRVDLDGGSPPIVTVPAPKRSRRRNTISMPDDLWRRLNVKRIAAGQTWPELLASLLED